MEKIQDTQQDTQYVIDASGRTLGRVASEAASVLIGKKSTSFVKYRVLPIQVIIKNLKKLWLPERRITGKEYTHYTGYPGGLRITSMADVIKKEGTSEVVRRAVKGMLPHNKLQKERLKRLTITD